MKPSVTYTQHSPAEVYDRLSRFDSGASDMLRASSFEEERFLPSQLTDCSEGDSEVHRIRRLFRALLEDALSCLTSVNQLQRRLDQRWFESSETGYGSFLFVCDELGVQPNFVRAFAQAVLERRVVFRRVSNTITARVNGRITLRRYQPNRHARYAERDA